MKPGIKEYESKEEGIIKKLSNNIIVKIALLIIVFGGLITLIIYFEIEQSRVYIEKAEISAPIILLSPQIPGILENIFVREGDKVKENTILARVNGEPIRAKSDGIIIYVQNNPGQIVTPQTPVIKMINPLEMRIIGHIQENKGLSKIKPWQNVVFTVDAFGSKKYNAIIDSVSPSSRDSDIVFSISNKRQEKEFDIKARFDINEYPELKNGMSAKMWVYN